MYYLTNLEVRTPTQVSQDYSKVISRATFLPGGSRGESIALLFPSSRGSPHPWLWPLSPILKPATLHLLTFLPLSRLPLTTPGKDYLLMWVCVIRLGHLANSGYSLHLKILKSPLPCEFGIRMWTSLRSRYSATVLTFLAAVTCACVSQGCLSLSMASVMFSPCPRLTSPPCKPCPVDSPRASLSSLTCTPHSGFCLLCVPVALLSSCLPAGPQLDQSSLT